MRTVDSATLTALGNPAVKARSLVWMTGIAYADGTTANFGFWTEVADASLQVIKPSDGTTISRTYLGFGAVLGIDNIPLTSDLTVRTTNVTMSQVDDRVTNAARAYNLKQQPIEIHRMLFNPNTYSQVAPAVPRFVGFIDKVEIKDPAAGKSDGSIVLSCVSVTRELTRTSPDLRSDQSQIRRLSTDHFFKYADVAGIIQVYWGKDKITTTRSSSGSNTLTPASVGGGLFGAVVAMMNRK